MTLRTPAIIALSSGMFDDGRSGVNRKNGIQNTSSQIAPTGPDNRSGSCNAWLTPNNVCLGMKLHGNTPGSENASSMNKSSTMPAKFPSDSASRLNPATRLCDASDRNNELWKTGKNADDTVPMP